MISYPNFSDCESNQQCNDLIIDFVNKNKDLNEFFYPKLYKAGAFRYTTDEFEINTFIDMERERLTNIEYEKYISNIKANKNETNEELLKRENFESEIYKIIQKKTDILINYELSRMK